MSAIVNFMIVPYPQVMMVRDEGPKAFIFLFWLFSKNILMGLLVDEHLFPSIHNRLYLGLFCLVHVNLNLNPKMDCNFLGCALNQKI